MILGSILSNEPLARSLLKNHPQDLQVIRLLVDFYFVTCWNY